nr:hypothetical protein [Tanacetum cinerariifolium]
MATGFEYKHDYTVIESPRAVIFQDKYGVQMMMRFNEIHKFSDGTLQQIDEALDYRVKEFRINRMNPCLNTRFWTKNDVDRCNVFMFAIQRRLRTRRIFRNLESFVGGRSLGKIKKEKSENKGRVPTEMELELEHTQQGSSYEVSKHLLLSNIEDSVMDPVPHKFNFPSHSRLGIDDGLDGTDHRYQGRCLGVSLSVVSTVDHKNGEIAGNGGIWSDDGSSDGSDTASDTGRTVGKTVGIFVGVTMVSVRVVGGEMVGVVSEIM